ncbi:MAG: GAF domain-containing protein [Candidatus Eremiobacterota bacterium]
MSEEIRIDQFLDLLEDSFSMYSTFKMDILLHNIMETATRIMKSEASSLMLLDEETDELVFEVALGEKKDMLSKIRIKVGEGIAGQVAKTGIPVLVNNVSSDTRFCSKIDDLTGFKTKSIICAPLKVDSTIIGVAEVLNPEGGKDFTEEDVRLFTIFSRLAAMSIQNSRIYNNLQDLMIKETQNQLNRLEVMSHISGVTLSVMDFSNLLKVMLEIVIQSLNLEAGVVYLVSEQNGDIFPVVFRGFYEGTLLKKQKLNISEQIVREVIATHKPLRMEGFTEKKPDGEGNEETHVIVGVPMKVKEKVIGSIVIFSKKGHDVQQQDIDFLKTFSRDTASSLEKIDIQQLFGKLKHKSESYKKATFEHLSLQGDAERYHLEVLSEYIPEAIVITDQDFNIQLVNKKAEIIFSMSGENITGKNIMDFHDSSLHDRIKEIKSRFLSRKELKKESFIEKLQENKDFNTTVLPVYDPCLNLRGFIIVMSERSSV